METDPAILYVEDDPLSRQVMDLLLVRGMKLSHVTIFDSSLEFMSRLAALTLKPTLILLDIHMTPHDGFALLKLLRDDELYRDTIVVALTASVMNEEVERLKSAGFNGVLAKPIDQIIFPKLLQRILNGERIWTIK